MNEIIKIVETCLFYIHIVVLLLTSENYTFNSFASSAEETHLPEMITLSHLRTVPNLTSCLDSQSNSQEVLEL